MRYRWLGLFYLGVSGCSVGSGGSSFGESSPSASVGGSSSDGSGSSETSSTGASTDSDGDATDGLDTGASGDESGAVTTSASSGDSTGGEASSVETFDDDPQWEAVNLPNGSNVFGYSESTQHAGGSGPGEVGGTFQRTLTASYYADTGLGPFEAEQTLSAGGRFNVLAQDVDFNGGALLGHFAVQAPEISFGIVISEGLAAGQYRVFAKAGGTAKQIYTIEGFGTAVDWSYSYDADGGVFGVLNVFVAGQPVEVVELTQADRDAVAQLDAFGLQAPPSVDGDAPGLLTLYADDLEYVR